MENLKNIHEFMTNFLQKNGYCDDYYIWNIYIFLH